MRNLVIAAAIALMPVTAFAQTGAPAAGEAIDPSRLTLAEVTVSYIWPLGTFERMMGGAATDMTNSMMESIFNTKMGDFPHEEGDDVDPEMADATLREAILKEDPHFEERLRIMNRVMMEGMAPIMAQMEPQIRQGLARAYAKRFTAEQLNDLNRFFATPSGRAYGAEMMLVHMDPEIMSAMTGLMPELLKEMPEIMKKAEAATAHLPPPPKSEEDEEDEEETETVG